MATVSGTLMTMKMPTCRNAARTSGSESTVEKFFRPTQGRSTIAPGAAKK